MDTPITWTRTATLYRNDFKTTAEYRRMYSEYAKHYGLKVRVEGGWMFFTFTADYETWKAQH